jgi:hypothetical protein
VAAFPASYTYEAQSVDARLRADDRLAAFLDLAGTTGNRFLVDPVTPDSLDTIAGTHDLTLVATGKAGLTDAFPTDTDRTPYTGPQRYLLTVTTTGLPSDHVFTGRTGGTQADRLTDTDGKPANNSLLSLHEEGEVFAGPYLHKDGLASWVLLAWAKPGTATEQAFRSTSDAASALQVLKDLHHREFPDIADDIDQLQPIETDPHSWLKGAVTPRVRRPVGETAGGHLVAALGDTAIAVDPIAGQGAQLGDWQVAALAAGLTAAASDGKDWDATLLTDLFEQHWENHGRAGVAVTSLFLGDPLYAEVAGAFFGNAGADPRLRHRPVQPVLRARAGGDVAHRGGRGALRRRLPEGHRMTRHRHIHLNAFDMTCVVHQSPRTVAPPRRSGAPLQRPVLLDRPRTTA